jgi:hypothetical protein
MFWVVLFYETPARLALVFLGWCAMLAQAVIGIESLSLNQQR